MTESLIFIDRNTSFEGAITAKEVIVEGTVKGDVTASDKVLIKNGGVINGDIITEKLLFEEGGEHNGLIRLGQPPDEEKEVEPVSISESLQPKRKDEQEDQDKSVSERNAEEKQKPKRLW